MSSVRNEASVMTRVAIAIGPRRSGERKMKSVKITTAAMRAIEIASCANGWSGLLAMVYRTSGGMMSEPRTLLSK